MSKPPRATRPNVLTITSSALAICLSLGIAGCTSSTEATAPGQPTQSAQPTPNAQPSEPKNTDGLACDSNAEALKNAKIAQMKRDYVGTIAENFPEGEVLTQISFELIQDIKVLEETFAGGAIEADKNAVLTINRPTENEVDLSYAISNCPVFNIIIDFKPTSSKEWPITIEMDGGVSYLALSESGVTFPNGNAERALQAFLMVAGEIQASRSAILGDGTYNITPPDYTISV